MLAVISGPDSTPRAEISGQFCCRATVRCVVERSVSIQVQHNRMTAAHATYATYGGARPEAKVGADGTLAEPLRLEALPARHTR